MNRARFAAAPISAFFVLVVVVAILSLASVPLWAESASAHYKQGVAAEAAENDPTVIGRPRNRQEGDREYAVPVFVLIFADVDEVNVATVNIERR